MKNKRGEWKMKGETKNPRITHATQVPFKNILVTNTRD